MTHGKETISGGVKEPKAATLQIMLTVDLDSDTWDCEYEFGTPLHEPLYDCKWKILERLNAAVQMIKGE